MNPRPLWQSRSVPVAVAAAVTAVLLLCATGTPGSGARWVVPLLGGAAAAVAVWALLRRRAERAAYEQRLTAWAATEAVLGERLRIARDLHDLVSHGLGLITVRAAATRGLPQSPQVRAAFTDIEEASRHATDELRRMLAVLRERDTAAPLEPLDDLSTLPAIVRAARRGGVRPRLSAVPPGVQVAVCAVVREGLANAARHAGPVPVDVRVHREDDQVVVTVADEGPAPGRPAAAPGTGSRPGRAARARRQPRRHNGGRPDGYGLSAHRPDPGVNVPGPGRPGPDAGVTRVLLADDQPLLRRSLATIIAAEPDLVVLGEAGDGAEAVLHARAARPDVVLMDVRMLAARGPSRRDPAYRPG